MFDLKHKIFLEFQNYWSKSKVILGKKSVQKIYLKSENAAQIFEEYCISFKIKYIKYIK